MALSTRLTALLLTTALLLPAAAWAKKDREEDPFDGRLVPIEAVMAFRRDIDLTREQNREIGRMVAELQKDVAAIQWEMQTAYFDLLDALDQPRVDERKALALAEQAINGENRVKLEQLKLLIRVRNLLEPEQVAFLRKKIADGWTEGG